MGWRFRKSIRIIPGVRVNLGKKGASVSLGGRGLTHTVGPKGSRTTVGIPGTGISYSTSRSLKAMGRRGTTGNSAGSTIGVLVLVGVLLLLFLAFFR